MKENPPVLSKPSRRFEETKTARWLCWPFKPTPFLVKFLIVGSVILTVVLFSFVTGQVNFPFKWITAKH